MFIFVYHQLLSHFRFATTGSESSVLYIDGADGGPGYPPLHVTSLKAHVPRFRRDTTPKCHRCLQVSSVTARTGGTYLIMGNLEVNITNVKSSKSANCLNHFFLNFPPLTIIEIVYSEIN